LIGLSTPGGAQVRGLPLFFESTYGHAGTLGVELGHGGELGGVSVLAAGSYHIRIGFSRRIALSAAAGVWDPRNGDPRFIGAAGLQVLLNRCPRVGCVSDLTFRVVTGVGVVNDAGRATWSAPIGIGAGWKLPLAVVHLEPWIVPHLIWLQKSQAGGALPLDGDSWKAAVSAGVTLGVGGVAGFRVAAECCVGGLGMGYSLSYWF
jgi:hypothetical protein